MLAADAALLETALTGGDDYEILAAVSAGKADAFRSAAAAAGIPVSEIGRIETGDAPPQFVRRDGSRLAFERPSYTHF
jgi:thiamine-monophosphate kinase